MRRQAQIDKVLYEFGFPMGPYALSDLAGIDLQYAARTARRDRLTERERAANFVDQLYALGRYGQKTGAGWYRYDENRKSLPDPAIDALLAAHSSARGLTRRQFTEQEILERCLYAMVNEGAKLIGEGIVPRPDEVDVAMINGIGFPAYTVARCGGRTALASRGSSRRCAVLPLRRRRMDSGAACSQVWPRLADAFTRAERPHEFRSFAKDAGVARAARRVHG